MEIPSCRCPLCSERLDPTKLSWTCQVCGCANQQSIMEMVCKHCYFSPRLMLCPECGEYFEIWALIGTHEGCYARLFHPDHYPIKTKVIQRVGDLEFAANAEFTQDHLTLISEVGLREMSRLEIHLPYKVEKIFVHTVHETGDRVLWVHSWLYKDSATSPPDESQAQFTIHCDVSKSKPNVRGWVTDIQMVQ